MSRESKTRRIKQLVPTTGNWYCLFLPRKTEEPGWSERVIAWAIIEEKDLNGRVYEFVDGICCGKGAYSDLSPADEWSSDHIEIFIHEDDDEEAAWRELRDVRETPQE